MSLIDAMIKAGWTNAQPKTCAYWDRESDFCALHRPSAQPQRKTGRWIWSPNGLDWNLGAWCCSECKFKAETWWANDEKYNPLMCSGGHFCGNCGAKMGDTNYELY